VINELDSTISVYAGADSPPNMHLIQNVSALPASGFSGSSDAAHIVISEDGSTLYASNRGHDSIAVFSVNPNQGTLALVAHVPTQAKFPRHFALSPDQHWLLVAGQKADQIEILALVDGIPKAPGTLCAIPRPTALVIA